MKIRALVAGGLAAVSLATLAVVPSAGATAPSIVEIVAASAADNPIDPTTGLPAATDHRWNDFDILLAAVGALGLTDAVAGLNGATVFAPADASFRGLVADLTNTPVWKLSEADVLNTLVAIAGEPDLNGTGISGATALTETVLYHVSPENVTNLRSRRSAIPTLSSLPDTTIRPLFGFILRDRDGNDLDPFTVSRAITASNGTVYVIAGVLRPLDLKVLFPGD
jgi:uncharacterized surface protein with fasciclin (FAS1) repeats